MDTTEDLERLWNRVLRASDLEIAINRAPIRRSEVPEILSGYDTCINDATYFDAELLSQCNGLRHIIFLGTGAANYIDLGAATTLGIRVSVIRGYGNTTVAEHAVALMFSAAREVAAMDRKIRAGGWGPIEGIELRGKTLGLIGLGEVGREVARIADAIGMKVIAWNRSKISCSQAENADLNTVLANSHIVSLHLSLNEETREFLSRERLAGMRVGSIFINTARAAIVDEPALVELLRCRHIRHAAIDVFDREPPPPENPLLQLENVTLTSHAGFMTPEATMNMLRQAIDIASGDPGI